MADVVTLTLYTSSFCGACQQTRAVLQRAAQLVGDRVVVEERNVASEPALAERAGIIVTPTVVMTASDGAERSRAQGVPTIEQVLAAVANALDE